MHLLPSHRVMACWPSRHSESEELFSALTSPLSLEFLRPWEVLPNLTSSFQFHFNTLSHVITLQINQSACNSQRAIPFSLPLEICRSIPRPPLPSPPLFVWASSEQLLLWIPTEPIFIIVLKAFILHYRSRWVIVHFSGWSDSTPIRW